MDLKFITPDLRRLDLFVGEMIVVPVALGQRPPRGSAGLLDYRLLGAISALITRDVFTGALGQSHSLRPRPRLPFDQCLLVGQGPEQAFNPQVYAAIVEQILTLLAEREVRRAVVELPGRAQNLIDPELAASIVLEKAERFPLLDTWTLIDTPETARNLGARLRRDRRAAWSTRPAT